MLPQLETGYVGVGDLDDVQLFYYFIESEGSPEHDPLVLWLTGGPGCSGFSGLVYESIGPLSFDYANSTGNKPQLKLNPYSWTKVANIIFIDAPVGTGYSYARTWEGYSNMSDTLSAAETYQFLRKWLMDHPNFLNNSLYIAGDSYSGIVLPIIVQEISDGNEDGLHPRMNIQGYVLGNPVTDLDVDYNYKVPFAFRKALISDELYQSMKRNCKGEYVSVDPNNALCVDDLDQYNECITDINTAQILEPFCTVSSPNPMESKWDPNDLSVNILLLLNSLGHGVGVTIISSLIFGQMIKLFKLLFMFGTEASRTGRDAIRAYQLHIHLIVLIYSGDHDMAIPYLGTVAWIESLNLTVESRWKPWFVNGQIAGYKVEYAYKKYQLTFTTIKGGGHTAPEYRPEECLAMISRWFAFYPSVVSNTIFTTFL
ncbi:hypothetical protein M0R45_007528 [Rubus argutus]|uniref:Serine carboxypeptidase-like 18 n=1 Tax=Rubus argutus TaxID=59490 RepID=A0AAW1Y110_RUBAR